MTSTTHLDALRLRLSSERVRLAGAKTKKEREMRAVWVAGYEKEVVGEMEFLAKRSGMAVAIDDLPEMSDDDLLAALEA